LSLGHLGAQVVEEGVGLEEGECARGCHVLTGADRLETDERNLHGHDCAKDVEDGVRLKNIIGLKVNMFGLFLSKG